MKLISIVVPCYNEEAVLPLFYQEITRVAGLLPEYRFEFLFVDDGSRDDTLKTLKHMATEDERVKYLSFSRNFGKEAAMYAGFSKSRGDFIALMDADLQDPPALLPEMLRAIEEEDYDSAATRRVTRKGEPPIRSFFARRFYQLMRHISKTEIVDGARDYRLMTRQFLDSLLELGEYNRFSKGLYGWVGYKTKWLEYENVERAAGETKWSFWKLLLYSIEGIVAFSEAPLALAGVMGIFFCLVAFAFIVFIVARTLMFGDPVAGWPSTICVILMCSGVQLFTIGILGKYLSKTYLEVKKRPIYLCRETNLDNARDAGKAEKHES